MGNRSIMQRIVFVLFIIPLALLYCSCNNHSSAESNGNVPHDGLKRLIEGNMRFVDDKSIHEHVTIEMIRELKSGQHPFAVILSCSDSRVPPELVFDQGLGDLFVIRNAGNIIGDYELGSIEYAVEHLEVPLVVVLGHTHCGAIGAYLDHKHDSIPNHIQSIVDYIKKEEIQDSLHPSNENYYEQAVIANVVHNVHALRTSGPVLNHFVNEGKTRIVGGIFNLETGKVFIVEP